MAKVSVLLTSDEEIRSSAYCKSHGFKKSTLIARLIREHLDREGYAFQTSLPLKEPTSKRRRGVNRKRR